MSPQLSAFSCVWLKFQLFVPMITLISPSSGNFISKWNICSDLAWERKVTSQGRSSDLPAAWVTLGRCWSSSRTARGSRQQEIPAVGWTTVHRGTWGVCWLPAGWHMGGPADVVPGKGERGRWASRHRQALVSIPAPAFPRGCWEDWDGAGVSVPARQQGGWPGKIHLLLCLLLYLLRGWAALAVFWYFSKIRY